MWCGMGSFRLQHVQFPRQAVTSSWIEAQCNDSQGQLSETLHRIVNTEYSAESIFFWRSALRRLAVSTQIQSCSTG